jgi:predicted PurR-regulated permease PerM
VSSTPPEAPKVPSPPRVEANPTPAPVAPFTHRLQVMALGLLTFVLIIHLMTHFATILQQLCIAALLGYLIVPLHRWLGRHGLSPLFSGIVLLAGFVGAVYGLGLMIYQSFEDLGSNLAEYQKNLKRMIGDVVEVIPGLDVETVERMIAGDAHTAADHARRLRSTVGSFLDFASNVVIVLVYLGFLLVEQASFTRRIRWAFGPARSRPILVVVGRINASITRYLAVMTFLSLLTGLLTTVVLWLFGVAYAVLWGVVTFLANYIPYVGSMVAVALPVLLCLVQFGSLWPAIGLLVVLTVINNVIGFVIQPMVAGRTLDLSPLMILLSLAFWGAIWGVVGMILAVPLMVVVKAILENIEETRPLAGLMAHTGSDSHSSGG